MTFENNIFQLSATDLSNHLSCRHLTELNRKVAMKELSQPYWKDPQLEILIERGRDHEKAYVEFLKASGKSVATGNTIDAMQKGVDVIVQATLASGQWGGIADILIKVPGKSKFGDWSYEVQDTKLAQNTRASTILQLCLYTELLAELQESFPEKFHVIKPVDDFEPESYRFDDFKAYYRSSKKNFENTIKSQPKETYPEPAEHCGVCRWWKVCDTQRHNDDYLSLVAGIRSTQIEELKSQGIRKLEVFAGLENIAEPTRGNRESYIKRQQQAKVQLEGRIKGQMIHHVIEKIEEGLGLSRLPEPNAGDVYFDIEGDAYFPSGGLEYMLGYAYRENGALIYKNFWATNRAEEKTAFAAFMKFLVERRVKFPGFNVYHFAPYESTAIKRLASVHTVYEQEVDELLRGERFIDLHAAFKESLLASVERYSLKDLEKFTTYTRKIELSDASIARKNVECALELNVFPQVSKETIATVEGYNEDDCLATEALHVWLEKLRSELVKSGVEFKRPFPKEQEPQPELKEREKQSLRLFEGLISSLPADRDTWTDEHHAKWLLAHQLNYFRREEKSASWEYFRLQKMEDEDAFGERKAITGLKFLAEFPGKKKNQLPSHKYSFPTQEVGMSEGDKLVITNSASETDKSGITFGTVEEINLAERTITVRKTKKSLELHPNSVHINDYVGPGVLWTSILSLAKEVEDEGVAHRSPYHASKDLLMRRKPKLVDGKEGAQLLPGEDVVAGAIRLALNLDKSILPIQGPPGAGKTTTAAKMIIALLKQQKKIGVTAISHRVIINLFEKVKEFADKEDFKIEFAHKGEDLDFAPEWLELLKNSDAVLKAIDAGKPVGGTAWLWAADSVVDKLDYLFIDEAGQMSLSQALAASRAAKNIILLGDPQQLEQPQKGSHPEGSDVAALTHLIGPHKAMPAEQGLFLGLTYRLHPDISAFTSELFYEGKLKSAEGLEKQIISGTEKFDGAGLYYVPVEHRGNQNMSLEEVSMIGQIVELLLKGSYQNEKISPKDILVVAPYNAQVAALASRLQGIQVGTVDKFQGKEAPIVIYSMTSSSHEDAPRGMNFLFSPNRLNVATSRAKSVCILVASPRLLEPECKTIDQMKWANGLCRYVEMVKYILLFFLLPFTGLSQSYSELIERAETAIQNKDLPLASSSYDLAFSRFKPDHSDLYNAACVNSLKGDALKSVQQLRRAFALGYTNFDWLHYDKDLNPIRNHPAYIEFEKQYHPESVIYYFDILKLLQDSDNADICDKTISISDGILADYSFDEIRARVGGDVKLAPGDTLLDFSKKRLSFCRCEFSNASGAYNVISHVALGAFVLSDCKGNLKLSDMEVQDVMFYEIGSKVNELRNLMFDDVRIEGAMNIRATGFQFFIRNSIFNTTPDEGDVVALVSHLTYERMSITNSVFNTKREDVDPFEINIIDSKRLLIQDSEFNHPMRMHGAVSDELNISQNKFPACVDLINLQLPDFNTYFPFSQLDDTKLVRIGYDENDNTIVQGDSTEDYSNTVLFDELTGLYKRLYDSYRSRADISSANRAYVRMKDIEITHLKVMENRNSEETLRLRLNQLMGFYTDHATSPGKALIISFYIVFAFGIFYWFFPSDWDRSSKGKLIADFKLFIEKNEQGYVRPFFKMMRGLVMSLFNAVALSMNAFITLGFGNIPTTGIARYVCILEGMLGWFLLSLFTVALLNQVLL